MRNKLEMDTFTETRYETNSKWTREHLGEEHKALVPHGGTRMLSTDRLEGTPHVDTRRRYHGDDVEECLCSKVYIHEGQEQDRAQPEHSQSTARAQPEQGQGTTRAQPERSQSRAKAQPEHSQSTARAQPERSQSRAKAQPEHNT
jgi:hypothetical protein